MIMVFRYFLCLIGVILALPLLGLVVLALTVPVTLSGALYLISGCFVAAGMIAAPARPKHYHLLVLIGMFGSISIAASRLYLTGQNTNSSIKMITLPQGQTMGWINRLIDEQDSLIFGEALFHMIGGDSDSEHDGLTSSLWSAYSEMRQEGPFASPIVSTYLGLQKPERFDAVIIEPNENSQPKFGVVFLHGYMGNVTAQCWEIAQAVKTLGGVTICPSTGWTGQWWQADGQKIIENTFDYLRERGIQEFYLGGFSNGGFSISRLALQWQKVDGLRGLFFIDGFTNGTEIRQVGLPVLIIEGRDDERVPVSAARQFASEVGDLGTYAELEGDHFLIMKNPDAVQDAIEKWLMERENDG